jgi:hypothetical protein
VENRDAAQGPRMIGLPARRHGADPNLIPGMALIKLIFSKFASQDFIWHALYVLPDRD